MPSGSSGRHFCFVLFILAKLKQSNYHPYLFELYNYLFESRNNSSVTAFYLCVISS
jgi:hypothetical protein